MLRHRTTRRRLSLTLVTTLALAASACTSSGEDAADSSDTPTTASAAEETTTTTEAAADTTTVPPTTEAPAPVSTLEWSDCGELECATLEVPLDHGDPDGEQIEIAVARVAAGAPDSKIGSLVFNPGGPGGSGIDFLKTALFTLPGEVQDRFDLVGFDPRGVGESTSVVCEPEIDDAVTLLEADDDAGWDALLEEAEAELETCSAEELEVARFVGTNNAARDLDLLRAALGDEQLSYVGYSYGTRLGATYAELFPERVRALVLDAGVKPVTELSELGKGQGEGFDRAFANFAEACDADPDCPLAELGTTDEVFASIESEIRELGSFPTDTDGRVLTAGEFYLGVIASLYSVDAWPILAEGLFVAEAVQDGSILQALGDSLQGRNPDGTYDNSNVANFFINCADDASRLSGDDARAAALEQAASSVRFDDALRGDPGCQFAPDPIDPLILGPATEAAPILVLGNTGDPATPYEWSVELADFLDTGVLYTVEAEGHTAYGSFDCVAPVVNSYLIDLEVPDEGGSCSENATADFFPAPGASAEPTLDQLVSFFACLNEGELDVEAFTISQLIAADADFDPFANLDLNDPDVAGVFLDCQSQL